MKRSLAIGAVVLAAILSTHYLATTRAHAAHVPAAGPPHIARWSGDAQAAISFTFDDGLQSHADIAAPLLKEFGLRGTFYVIAGLTREHKSDPPHPDPRFHFGEAALSWDEIRAIHDMGMEIGNHSLTHGFLNHITDDAVLDDQIDHAADLIEQQIGQRPVTFAFPYNESTPHTRELVLAHHLAIRDHWTDYGGAAFTTAIANALVVKAMHTHAWLVPMIHGIDGGFLPLSSAVLRNHLAFVKAHSDEVWVDTYADVARYDLERDAATLHVEDSNPGEMTFSLTGSRGPASAVPLTVVLPLSLSGETDDVDAELATSGQAVPIVREPDRVLVELPPTKEPVRVTWR